jgi:hypothetical protein
MIAGMYQMDPTIQYKDDPISAQVASMEYSRGNLLLAGEYSLTAGEFEHPAFGFEMNREGYYAQGSYRLNRWFEFGSYYSVHYEDKDDREGEGYDPTFNAWQKDLAVSLRFDVSPNMIFKLEGHRMDGTALVMNADNPLLLLSPDSLSQDWYMFATKISFVF